MFHVERTQPSRGALLVSRSACCMLGFASLESRSEYRNAGNASLAAQRKRSTWNFAQSASDRRA